MKAETSSESKTRTLPTAKILLWNKKLCNVECAVVEEFGEALYELVDYMRGTMYKHNGVGLAAPQVGVFKRVAIIQLVEDRTRPPFVMVNPAIVNSAGTGVDREGCLSIPGTYVRHQVRRPHFVKVIFQDINGKPEVLETSGMMARAIQHEVDHLHGKFFIDHLSRLKRDMILTNYRKSIRGGYLKPDYQYDAEPETAQLEAIEKPEKPVAPFRPEGFDPIGGVA